MTDKIALSSSGVADDLTLESPNLETDLGVLLNNDNLPNSADFGVPLIVFDNPNKDLGVELSNRNEVVGVARELKTCGIATGVLSVQDVLL